jgi:YVTN family beta-propeller protein
MSPGLTFSRLKLAFLLPLTFVIAILTSGCGNQFRPVAIPIPQNGGDPGTLHDAIVLSTNGASPGSTMHIDVSGDSVSAINTAGIGPVYAALINNQTRTMVVNQADGTLSSYTTFGGPGTSVTTTLLPSGSCPTFVASTENANAWVTEPGSCSPTGPGSVGVISLLSLAQTASVSVGTNPVALAELANGAKVYVANKGSNSISVINSSDQSVPTTITAGIGVAPSHVVASNETGNTNDNHGCVYVANSGSSSVSVINPFTDTVASTITVAAGPTFLRFDKNLQRVYVVSPSSNSITVLAHNTSCTPTVLKTVTAGISFNAGTLGPISQLVTALANGTRFYVANNGNNTVTVYDAGSFTLLKTIPVGSDPVSIDASPDSIRVYTANQGSGNVSVINTSNDTVATTLNAPSGQTPIQVQVTQ